MLTSRRAGLAAGGAAVLVGAAVVVSLVVLGEDEPALEPVGPSCSGDSLAEALAVLPAGVGRLDFTDRAQAADRLGLDGSSAEAYLASVDDYLDSTLDADPADVGGLLGPLSVYLTPMIELPFSDYTTIWSATTSSGAEAVGIEELNVYRVSAEADLDGLADDLLDAGLEEDDLLGRRHFTATSPAEITDDVGLIGDGYPAEFLEVVLDVEAGLVVTGSRGEDVLRVLDGLSPSLADSGDFDAVAGDLAPVEVAGLTSGADCDAGPADLARPLQAGYLVHGADATLSARLVFDDAATAVADLKARTAFFEAGPVGEDAAPLDSYGTYAVIQDGRVVEVELSAMSSDVLRDLAQAPGSIIGC